MVCTLLKRLNNQTIKPNILLGSFTPVLDDPVKYLARLVPDNFVSVNSEITL